MSKDKKIVFVDSEKTKNVFADIIEVSINNETAKFKIAMKDENSTTANTSHNIIITLPHFLRLADAMSKTSEEILKQINVPKK